VAQALGDDVAATRLSFLTDANRPSDVMRALVPSLAAATGWSRTRVLAAALASGRRIDAAAPPATCEVARDAARRLGLPGPVQDSLFHTLAMWNGKGYPPVSGEAIPLSARIMHVASTAVLFCLHAGAGAAMAELHRRARTYLDPAIAAAFSAELLDDLEDLDAYGEVLDCEPDPVRLVDDGELEAVARTFGDVVDLKTPWLHGHSGAVAELAAQAARLAGVSDVRRVRVAGHLHDLGRVGVSSRIWAKPGPLSATERDQARLHPYYTERIVSRVPALADVATVASQHHERCDGSGYHRGVNASQLALPARILAAADCYCSRVEERPYRPAAPPAEAAGRLRDEARAGRLDADAVEAVLTAAGQGGGARRHRTGGLTERQAEVLALMARGLSNREIASRLVISRRTAERHVQDVYVRIGVSTRAGAALFAMEHGMLDRPG
jgi:HD-GYP domain-containing protein (c-di-GMP phosphodiesterase class II)